jgi:hypothetical protein
VVAAATAGILLLTSCVWTSGRAGAEAGGDEVADSVAAPSAANVSPSCAVPDPARVLGPVATLPSQPVTTVVKPSGGIYTMAVDPSGVYVVNGGGLSVYNLSGSLIRSFPIAPGLTGYGSNGISQPVVGPSGDIYLSSYYGQTVDAYSPTGQLLWSADPDGGNPNNIFAVTSAAGAWELAVSNTQDHSASYVYSAAGSRVGTTALWATGGNTSFSQESDGDILYADGQGLVQTWAPDGSRMLSEFGSPDIEGADAHTGGAYEFYFAGQAVQGPGGDIYAADPLDTLTVSSSSGLLEGATTLGGYPNFEQNGALFVVGDDLYFDSGQPFSDNSAVVMVPISVVQEYLDAPQAPLDSLGWGAGLSTPEPGNYFPPGTTATVTADFASSWTALAPDLELSYSFWNDASMMNETVPAATTIPLPTTAAGLAQIDLPVPAGDTTAGPYQVRAELWNESVSPPELLGATCMPYTVGGAGDRLDLSALPAGVSSGGPSDPRGVALNSQLGLSGMRGALIDWSDFLPDCSPSAPTAATCGPSAMTFADAPQSYFQAAGLAAEDHVTYWVQVSGGDATSMALVDDGWWGADIEKLAAYYASPPSGCAGCAGVSAWEPWNEANNTGWSDPASYVSQVLAPFYQGVKAGDPSATVIGGSSLGVPLGWWQGLIAAGGLADLDVASIHPYPGNNDAWEEDGIPGQISDLEGMLGSTPVWITEVGWWSNGDYNYLHQADAVSRALLWQHVLHIPVWNYFFDEGSWGNDGVSFSLIQTDGNGDDYVKPAALATMTETATTAGRPYESMPATGIPQAYDARFGPSSTSQTSLDALWTDDLHVAASIVVTAPDGGTIPVTVTSEYGATTDVTLASGVARAITLSGQVRYVSYPSGDTLRVQPIEDYGPDLALSSSGATATASSGDASAAIVGLDATTGEGQGWSSDAGDVDPSITVDLPSAATVDRVIVDTQSQGSTAFGLRHYTVSVESPGGTWSTVATVIGEYRNHERQLDFAPQPVIAVRIDVTVVNFGGYYGGGIPPWWLPNDPGTAFLHAVEVYAGTDQPAQLEGRALRPLT